MVVPNFFAQGVYARTFKELEITTSGGCCSEVQYYIIYKDCDITDFLKDFFPDLYNEVIEAYNCEELNNSLETSADSIVWQHEEYAMTAAQQIYAFY